MEIYSTTLLFSLSLLVFLDSSLALLNPAVNLPANSNQDTGNKLKPQYEITYGGGGGSGGITGRRWLREMSSVKYEGMEKLSRNHDANPNLSRPSVLPIHAKIPEDSATEIFTLINKDYKPSGQRRRPIHN